MRNILNGSVARHVFSMDNGASSGTKGWWPFANKNNQQQQPRQQQQPPSNRQQPQNSQQNSDQNNQNQQQQKVDGEEESTGNEYEDFLRDNADLWQDKVEGNDIPDPQKVEEDKQKRTEAQQTRLREYIGKLDFGIKVDMIKLNESLEKGDPEYLQGVLSDAAKRVFAKQFDDFTRMITAAEDRFKEYADGISQNNISARESENSLFETMPLAANPVFKPIAMSIKARAMKKGKTDEQANEIVQKAFKTLRTADPAALGLDEEDDLTRPNNGQRPTNTNRARRGQQEPPDFVAMLTNQQ